MVISVQMHYENNHDIFGVDPPVAAAADPPGATNDPRLASRFRMIRKLKSGQYRLYSRKKDASSGKRKNLGTFDTLEKAKQHEREVQYFKKH